MSYNGQSINVATNFTNPGACESTGGGSGGGAFFLPNIFASVDVLAQSDTGGGAGAIVTASDCGVIYTPTNVTISVPAITNNPKPPITGTCVNGDNLTIYVTPTNESFSGIICTGGIYTVTPTVTIPDGSYCGNVVAVTPTTNPDGSFQSATAQSCGIVDTITFITTTVPTITSDSTPNITGTCESGGTVTINITNGVPSTNVVQTLPNFVCDNTCTYTVAPTNPISDGPYCANGRIVDPQGNIANSVPGCGIIDTATYITTTVPPVTSDPTPNSKGTCETGGTVTITITNGNPSTNVLQTLPNFVCDNTGIFTISPPNIIPDGPYCAKGRIVDVLNNVANSVPGCSIIDTTTFITTTVPPTTNNPTPPVTGTCEPLGIVTIRITNGAVSATNPTPSVLQTLPNFTCDNTGTYSVIPPTPIPNGPYCALGNIVDVAGNTANSVASCGVVDTATFVTVSVPQLTNSHFPTITGTCEVGASLEIKTYSGTNLGSGNTTNILPTETITQVCPANGTVANPTVGTYTTTPTVSIPNGNYSATTKATDTTGNIANATDAGVIDDAILVTVSVPALTNNPKPPITGDCKTGATVSIVVTYGAGNTSTLSPAIPNFTCVGITYSVNPSSDLPNGNYCANATSVDTIGNSAGPVQSCGIIDTTTFITTTVPLISKNPKPTINGTCEIGGTITITITNGSPSTNVLQILPSFICPNTSTYLVTPLNNIPDGPYCANGRIVDAVGNSANSIPGCGTIDTSTFVTVVVPPITNNPRPQLNGTCEIGASVILTITTGATNNILQSLPSFVCDNTGAYSKIPTADIAQGQYCVKADASDLAGNTATAQGCGNIFVTVSVPPITTNPKPEISGTCTPSTSGGFQVPVKIVIKVGLNNLFNEEINTLCSIEGTYRVTPLVIIPIGLFTATATATDSIGNEAIATSSGTVTEENQPQGPTITITPQNPSPEIFDHISDPYICGKSIKGNVISNYGIKTVVIKLFASKLNDSFEISPSYIFRPTLSEVGDYEIMIDYTNQQVFNKGMYKVEYYSQSNANSLRSGSYLAKITDNCSEIIPTVIQQEVEITPEGKITVRTGGGFGIYYLSFILATVLSYAWFTFKKQNFGIKEFFQKK
jgi:large repetitive protein